jgi:glycosyltransferase involved in cell wall biosynthesis
LTTGTPGTTGPRVLIVVTSTDRRGAEIEGSRLARELCARGVNAAAVALAPGSSDATIGIPVLGATPLGLRTLHALRRSARHVDIVIAYGSRTLPACAIALAGTRTPFVYRSIGDPRHWAGGRLQQRRTRLLLRRAWRVVALWPASRESLQRLYHLPDARLTVIPNARDPHEFTVVTPSARLQARSQLGVPPDVPLVAVIGALTTDKGVDRAIDAVARLDGVHIAVVGDGPHTAMILTQLDRNVGPRGHVVGAVADVRPILCAADVVVSTSHTEGLPGVLIEAGLCGLPVVATDVGAVRWLFDIGLHGELVGAHATTDVVADALRRVLDDRSDAERTMAATFDWATVGDRWYDLLTSPTTDAPDPGQHRSTAVPARSSANAAAGLTASVTAIVVTYRRPDALADTLDQLAAQTRPPDSTIVVDNDPDESARTIVDGRRNVGYLAAGDNLGPSGAISLAMTRVVVDASDEDLVLLVDDDDPPPDPDSIERVVSAIAEAQAQGWRCAGAGLAGARFRPARAAFVRVPDDELHGPVGVDYIGGGQCPIYRVEAIRTVGAFDTGFFFGFDDADFGLRLRAAGWALVVPGEYWAELRSRRGRTGAVATRSTVPAAAWRQYYSARNTVHLARRHGNRRGRVVAAMRGAVSSPARSVLVHGSPAVAWASGRGTLDGLRGELGRTDLPS